MRFNRGFLATIRFGQEYIFSFIEEASIMLKPILRLYTSRKFQPLNQSPAQVGSILASVEKTCWTSFHHNSC